MERRTVLQGFASVAALAPFVPLRVLAQSQAFTAAELITLKAVAEVSLPSAVSPRDRDAVVNRFAAWFVNYRVGADRGHSYGDSRLSAASPALNTTRYPSQIAALEKAAKDQGAASFAALAPVKRRALVESALNDPQPAARLSARPTGTNVIADLLGFYFNSPAAYNLAYKAQIDRDECRGLPRLGEGSGAHGGEVMATYDCDVCIIGGGITAAMVAQKLTELRPGISVIVVEAGKRLFDFENRFEYRDRNLEYGENMWPGDFVADQGGRGVISRSMAVGGSALHWGGVCNRFSEEDTRLKSMYGLAADWPIEWKDLESSYCEAERRIGVSGEASPLPPDRMSKPYPMPAMPMTYNLIQLKSWAEKSGIPFWTTPQAKNTVDKYGGRSVCHRCNTCEICPTGAKYTPDWTFKQLLAAKKIQLHDQTLVRRLVLDDKTTKIAAATGVKETGTADRHEDVEYRAKTFVLASGYTWSPHLLLLSANSRFPTGLANSSDHVGRYMTGHLAHETTIDLDLKIFPGMNEQHSLITRQFFRCAADKPYVRHDFRVWESGSGRQPRLRDSAGKLLLGDDLMNEWRTRTTRGSARVRGYFDVHPDKDSRLTLDPATKNRWGDPMPVVAHKIDAASESRQAATLQHMKDLFAQLAKANDGKMGQVSSLGYQDHPSGGCRMGADPAASVVDTHGRTHDHENLFVVGSPTLPTGGCTNATLTFAALALRSTEAIAR